MVAAEKGKCEVGAVPGEEGSRARGTASVAPQGRLSPRRRWPGLRQVPYTAAGDGVAAFRSGWRGRHEAVIGGRVELAGGTSASAPPHVLPGSRPCWTRGSA
ncbi:unnamed protein product [Prorocentrum cordatum]|nr:unnamed protein product [Polarella glacialis]